MTIAFTNLMTALTTPMKQSKKKLKYRNTLNALKLFMASTFELRLRKIYSDAILLIIIFKMITIKAGTNFKNKSNQFLDENIKHIARMTNPVIKIKMYIIT